MAITPNSVVHLLNVPLENNYKNQVYFDTRSDQTTEMKRHIVVGRQGDLFTFENLTYIKKDNILRIPKHIDDLYKCNYVMYKNTNYSDRWFYAFITNMEYINDGRTDITIETDVWQTWFDLITLKDSFIEREHVPLEEDTIGKHTFPEGLETGEYICNARYTDENTDNLLKDMCYIVASTLSSTQDSAGKFSGAGGGKYNGIYSGVKYYRFDTANGIDNLLKAYVDAGQGEGVNGVFMSPKWLAVCDSNIGAINQSDTPRTYDIDIDKGETTINGYTPKNKKLFCYPFRYLMVSNNNGTNAVYRYEDWYSDTLKFRVKGAICPGCSIRLTPLAYKELAEYDEESINLGKFPICNWTTDMYTNWMVKNSSSIQNSYYQSLVTGGLGMVGNAMTGNIGGVLSSGANAYFGIKSTMAEVEKQSMTPPQANGNLNCGDVITSSSKNTFFFYQMSCKKEYLEKIDSFFEFYGYQVNRVKTPDINHRKYWNYIKTIGVNLDGECPQDDLTKIREMFDNGVTFWHDMNNVEDYSLDNHEEKIYG